MNALRFDTRSVPPGQRCTFWRDVVQDVFHLDSESTALGPNASLEAAVEKHSLGELAVFTVRGGSQQVVVQHDAGHATAHVFFPLTPGGTIEVNGVRRALLPGCAYLVHAVAPTLIRTPERFEHLSLAVPWTSLKGELSLLDRCETGPIVLSGAVATTLAITLRTLFANASGITADAAPSVATSMVELLRGALVESLRGPASLAQHQDSHHRQRIRQHALSRLADPDLGVESIAAAVALSTRRIHQLFADSDMTLMRWIWSERLTQCYNQLVARTGAATRVGDVGYEWGFSDPAHFSRAFRQRYGVSPSQLLRQRAEAVAPPVASTVA